MKPIVPCVLFIAIVLTLAAGCVAPTARNTSTTFENTTNISPNTTVSVLNATPGIPAPLNGSLVVSVGGFHYPTNLSVNLDSSPVGIVNPTSSLYLMVPEGNHTVGVCADFICEYENVTIRFGKYVTVDFSERLRRDVVVKQPTVRVLECYKNGDQLTVNIEFINPSGKNIQMSGSVVCGYSYIDSRSGTRKGDAARGTFLQKVNAGQRTIENLDIDLVNGNSLTYGYPVIEDLKVI
jgi:hypothetical protein